MFPFQNVMQIMQYVNQIRSNPNCMGQFLLQNGKITDQQYQEIQQLGISGNPQAIGQYLMDRGMMNRQQVQDVYQNQAIPIQNSMKQN
ncbi:MAG: hypothetical protein IKZ85_01205 [Pseudobutyrivibrio sp.]|nr:hypothetical protein [Pseudobutyrivibrio sp.]